VRIAHVTDVYLPRLGGVELQVHDLARRQQLAGDETFVVTTTAGGLGDVPVRRLAPEGFGAGPYRNVPPGDLRAALDADAVHVHLSAFSPLAWSAARLATTTRIPTVVSVHSMWHDILPLVRGYARWQRATEWPVTWAAVSTVAAAAVREALDGGPVAVLPNGIDPSAWLQPASPRARDIPTLISVMRMVRRKRPRALLRTLLSLRAARGGGFRIVLVGDGPLLPALRRDVARAGADADVRLAGARDRDAIRSLLARADLYLAPAPRESFGIAALEARSAGLPVVARAGSGVGDFIQDGLEGWLVGSDAELFSTVAGLLDAPERLAAAARHNRQVAPTVHWDAVLATANGLYERAGVLPVPHR
jgi:glycosyltransferase involved in cell wall biosynthesis